MPEIRPEDIASTARPRARKASPALTLARDTVNELALSMEGNGRSKDPFREARDFLVEYLRERFEKLGVGAGDVRFLEPKDSVAQRGEKTYAIGATGMSVQARRYTDVWAQRQGELLLQHEIASPTVTLVRTDVLNEEGSKLSVVQLQPAQPGIAQKVISCTDGLLLDTGVAKNIRALNRGHALSVHGDKRLRTITSADSRDLEAIQGGEVADFRTQIQQVVPGLFITEFRSAQSGLNVTDADGFRSK